MPRRHRDAPPVDLRADRPHCDRLRRLVGMGAAIAGRLREEGANVVAFARRRDLLEREAERIGAVPVAGDLTKAEDLERLVETTVDRFGGIDILVNNGGGPPRGTAVDVDDESLQSAVDLLLFSAVRLTRSACPTSAPTAAAGS